LSYKYLEHSTDIFIEVTANTLEQAFIISAYAAIEAMINRTKIENKVRKIITVDAIDLEQLLYDWLEEVIILTITDCFAIHYIMIKIMKQNTSYKLQAIIIGDKLDIQKHQFKLEIKSPTFHLMEINVNNTKINMKFILDI